MKDKDYWHKKESMPEEIKNELGEIIKNGRLTELSDGEYVTVLLKADGETFKKIFSINRKYLFRGDFTAPPEEYGYGESECYITKNGLAGFSITENGWLVSVFSNQNGRGFLETIKPIVIKKAEKLVCISGSRYSGGLVKVYESIFGFKVLAKTTNDAEIMSEYYGSDFIDNFIAHYGEPYHVFMIRSENTFADYKINIFNDYFEAEDFVLKHKID